MKINTDIIYEMEIYGISQRDMLYLIDLKNPTETSTKYVYLNENNNEIYIIEKTISNENTEIQIDKDIKYSSHYYSYICLFNNKRMIIKSDTQERPIPQDVVNKLIGYALFHDLDFRLQKVER